MADKLMILATNENFHTIDKMILMYAYNAKRLKWYDDITILFWGGSFQTVTSHPTLEKKISDCIKEGVKVKGCRACCELMNLDTQAENMGIKLFYAGEYLSECMKNPDVDVLSV
jgi:hypothetical protein